MSALEEWLWEVGKVDAVRWGDGDCGDSVGKYWRSFWSIFRVLDRELDWIEDRKGAARI